MILFLHGADTFRSSARLRELMDGFVKKYDSARMNIAVISEKTDPWAVRGLLGSLPFLASRRLVVVRDLLTLPADVLAALAEASSGGVPETSVLLVRVAADLEEKKKYKEAAEPFCSSVGATIEVCAELQGKAFDDFVARLLKKNNCRITRDALREFVWRCQGDLWRIDQESKKLASFCGEKEAILEDVRVAVGGVEEEDMFALLDALAAGNWAGALFCLERQKRAGVTPYSMLSMMVWQMRLLVSARLLLDEDPRAAVTTRMKVKPFVGEKAASMARRWSLPDLRAIYQGLLQVDIKMKTGGGDPEALLALLVVKV
ncbi:MAG: DNA polymerase III subunit delta [Patescibacteria group bacterium]